MGKRKSKTYKKKLSKKSKTIKNKTIKKGGGLVNFLACRANLGYITESYKNKHPCFVADKYKILLDSNCSSMFKSKSNIDKIGKSAIIECSKRDPKRIPNDLSKPITWDDIDVNSMK